MPGWQVLSLLVGQSDKADVVLNALRLRIQQTVSLYGIRVGVASFLGDGHSGEMLVRIFDELQVALPALVQCRACSSTPTKLIDITQDLLGCIVLVRTRVHKSCDHGGTRVHVDLLLEVHVLELTFFVFTRLSEAVSLAEASLFKHSSAEDA